MSREFNDLDVADKCKIRESLYEFFKYFGVVGPFLDEPIMDGDEVVDNMTADGNRVYGTFTNALAEVGNALDTLNGNSECGDKIEEIIDTLDKLVNECR